MQCIERGMKNVDRNNIEYVWRMITKMQSIPCNCSQNDSEIIIHERVNL